MQQPMTELDVMGRLPHRSPFRFVSAISALEPGVQGVANWEVSGEEAFFAGHFPGQPIVPGVLLAESLAQLAGLVGFSEASAPQGVARLAHVDIKFGHAIAPPALISLAARLIRRMDHLMLFEVTAQVDRKTAAKGWLTLAAPGPVQEVVW